MGKIVPPPSPQSILTGLMNVNDWWLTGVDAERQSVAHRRLRAGAAGEGVLAGAVLQPRHVRHPLGVPRHGHRSRPQGPGVQPRRVGSRPLLLLPLDRCPGAARWPGRLCPQYPRAGRGARPPDAHPSGSWTARFHIPLSRFVHVFKLFSRDP